MSDKKNCCCGQGRICPTHGDSTPGERIPDGLKIPPPTNTELRFGPRDTHGFTRKQSEQIQQLTAENTRLRDELKNVTLKIGSYDEVVLPVQQQLQSITQQLERARKDGEIAKLARELVMSAGKMFAPNPAEPESCDRSYEAFAAYNTAWKQLKAAISATKTDGGKCSYCNGNPIAGGCPRCGVGTTKQK